MDKQVLCIGELLIDFICSDINTGLDEGVNFIKKAGGAPANVAATLTKLGAKALFAGKVGKDSFGSFLKNVLRENNVDVSMLAMDENSNTTLAFVSLKSDGERDFIFNRGADELYSISDMDKAVVLNSSIIHLGSATALLGGPLKEAYAYAAKLAKDSGRFISFDPNFRIDLWKGRIPEFVSSAKEYIKVSDFVKVSDEEIRIITGEDEIEKGVQEMHRLGARAAAVTLGEKGTYVSNGKASGVVESIKIKSIDSTGAGDAFVGAFLYKLLQCENACAAVDSFDMLCDITSFANKVGALVCTKLGAIAAIPDINEVNNFNR